MTSHASRAQSAVSCANVAPDNDADLPGGIAQSLYIGTAGDIAFHDALGNVIAATAVGVGHFPVQVKRVLATGTDAADILALYDKG